MPWIAIACRLLSVVLYSAAVAQNGAADTIRTEPADGFRGIWYFNQPSKDEYRYKYSGGMATYPQQHVPIAIYAPAVRKTFFVYGGTTARSANERQELLHMVAWFDHQTGAVSRPRVLLNKKTEDAHDNPVLSIDGAGHLWVFSPSHGTARASYIHRSTRPYDVSEFERVSVTNFSYPQPWYLPERGFLFLHTRYGRTPGAGVRGLYAMASADGRLWSRFQSVANIAQGDYQISWPAGASRLGTAFDHHPAPLGLNARANIYYIETRDGGSTWETVDGRRVVTPVTNVANPALIFDSVTLGRLVYLKDLNYDHEGRPVILFLLSRGFESGPRNGPREWMTTRWTGTNWETRPLTTSGNNYDHGSLYIEPDGTWRVIAPTETGPQPGNPGGEMVMWISRDQGGHWTKHRQLTKGSTRNHTYARRPLHAAPEFYALWADGDARKPSESALYFTDREGTAVWRLPSQMRNEASAPEKVSFDARSRWMGTEPTSAAAYVQSGTLSAPEAIQAAAADEHFVYAISSTEVAKYDRNTGQRLAVSKGEAKHLNSGFLLERKLYCAHSNYPRKPEQSEIMVLDTETMELSVHKAFAENRGSLTWAVRDGESWWCNFAHYGADNAKTVLVKFNADWKEQGTWTYPAEVIKGLGKMSISGGLWKEGVLLATGHDHKVIYRLRLPEQGRVLELIDIARSPFPGQGIAVDPKTGGLVGIDRDKKRVVFGQLNVSRTVP